MTAGVRGVVFAIGWWAIGDGEDTVAYSVAIRKAEVHFN